MSKKKPNISPEDKALFRDSMKGVRPLGDDGSAELPQPPKPKIRPKYSAIDDFSTQPAFEPGNFTSEEVIEYFNTGLQHKVVKNLKQGHFPIDGTLDLHGLISDEAYRALSQFLDKATTLHWHCVLIIHGKGYSSPNQMPILKNHAYAWLKNHPRVLGFHSAKPYHGGTGAVYVLLKR